MAKRQRNVIFPVDVAQEVTFEIKRRDRHWEVRDPAGDLVCLTVYKCGAQEVVRRLCLLHGAGQLTLTRR
jgi:hypothetical protein